MCACTRYITCVSIHAPLARSNTRRFQPMEGDQVSIHAPLARSNTPTRQSPTPRISFNTCSSCEEQLRKCATSCKNSLFQYMLLLRGATAKIELKRLKTTVSIHAPLARSNSIVRRWRGCMDGFNTCSSCEEQPGIDYRATPAQVSIHAPLARSNAVPPAGQNHLYSFNTCSSCEEQLGRWSLYDGSERFNTCSSCEEQLHACDIQHGRGCFNTCSSCEEQHGTCLPRLKTGWFQYMLLLRGATRTLKKPINWQMFQYMLLLRGATGEKSVRKEADGKFQYMLLLRGATGAAGGGKALWIGFNTCSSCEEQRG